MKKTQIENHIGLKKKNKLKLTLLTAFNKIFFFPNFFTQTRGVCTVQLNKKKYSCDSNLNKLLRVL